jgi:hypothetical protein
MANELTDFQAGDEMTLGASEVNRRLGRAENRIQILLIDFRRLIRRSGEPFTIEKTEPTV